MDNIAGIPGLGPKKVEKLFKEKTLEEKLEIVLETYKTYFPEDWSNTLLFFGRLLYIKRKDNDLFSIDRLKELVNEAGKNSTELEVS